MAANVSLRPVTDSDLPVLELTRTDPVEASEFGYNGFRSNNALRREFADNGLLHEDGGMLAVIADRETIGMVSWRRVTTGPISFTWNIGISLVETGRGRGYGTAAQRALVDYLFGYTQAHRIEACTEIGNIAEQRALEKAGFTRDGVVRGAAFRAGRWRDMASYAVLRTDFPDRFADQPASAA